MTIIATVQVPGSTIEEYDALRAECGWLETAPTGGLAHLTYVHDGQLFNVDAWESPEALEAFVNDRLAPAMRKVGITTAPVVAVYPAHEVFLPNARTVTATPVG